MTAINQSKNTIVAPPPGRISPDDRPFNPR
jgi:hypothetical protein